MKLQLDTENKIIKLEDKIKFSDLIKTLNSLFPDGSWMGYTLETNTIIQNFHSPMIVQPYVQPFYPEVPWGIRYNHNDQILCGTSIINTNGSPTTTAASAVYNIEVDLTQK